MIKEIALPRRATALISAAALVAASAAPLLLGSQRASAAQLTSRKITIGSSVVSKTDVTYTAAFTTATSSAIEGIVIDFCSNSPLIGQSCTAPTGLNVNQSGLAFTVAGPTGTGTFAKSIDPDADANTVILTRTEATSQTAPLTITVTLGGAGASDGITNPSANGTFYARILTYATTAGANGYLDTAPGTRVDDGGIALSLANQLTINARVQEQLQFCVGTTLANPGTAQCSDMSGTAIDLGVVDSSAVSASANDAGKAMVRTNAVNGVVVDYFAEQNNGSGKLKVAGATCSATSLTDQCFNSAGTVQSAITAGTEKFGVTAEGVNVTNGTTANLSRDADYDGSVGGYAWDDTGTTDRIASSTTVVDDEMLELKFAATASVTTPTGAYAVTSTYVATATF